MKGTDDVLAGDFFKLLREGRREIGLCTGILRYYGTKGIGKKARLYHQALGIANDSEHGLAGAVYSKDAERAKKVALAIETGQIFINQPSSAHPELPFGGIKNSGFGREMSDIGLFEFANEKIVVD